MHSARDAYRQKLTDMGEAAAKAQMEAMGFLSTEQRVWTAEWLGEKEEDRVRRGEGRSDRTVIAAERAAIASEKSARFAMWSAIIALATVAVTVLMGGFLTWLFNS